MNTLVLEPEKVSSLVYTDDPMALWGSEYLSHAECYSLISL